VRTVPLIRTAKSGLSLRRERSTANAGGYLRPVRCRQRTSAALCERGPKEVEVRCPRTHQGRIAGAGVTMEIDQRSSAEGSVVMPTSPFTRYGSSAPVKTNSNPIPEPATIFVIESSTLLPDRSGITRRRSSRNHETGLAAVDDTSAVLSGEAVLTRTTALQR